MEDTFRGKRIAICLYQIEHQQHFLNKNEAQRMNAHKYISAIGRTSKVF